MTLTRVEVAADLRAAIEHERTEPDTKIRKFRVQALEMLLTQYEDKVT